MFRQLGLGEKQRILFHSEFESNDFEKYIKFHPSWGLIIDSFADYFNLNRSEVDPVIPYADSHTFNSSIGYIERDALGNGIWLTLVPRNCPNANDEIAKLVSLFQKLGIQAEYGKFDTALVLHWNAAH